MIQVTFLPSNRSTEAAPGERLIDVSERVGLAVDSECGGRGKCGKCLVAFEKRKVLPGMLSDPGVAEKKLLPGDRDGLFFRLACMTRIYRDVAVTVSPENQAADTVLRKPFSRFAIPIHPAVEKLTITLDADPEEESDRSLSSRIRDAVVRKTGRAQVTGPGIAAMAAFAANPEFDRVREITATLYKDREIIQVQAGRSPGLYGVALDVGTTSVAVFLCDLAKDKIVGTASVLNPQVTYGSDVISRIARVRKDLSNLKIMQATLIRVVNRLIRQTADALNIAEEDILDVVAVGNPTMQHLFLGLNPVTLGVAPYAPLHGDEDEASTRSLGLYAAEAARIHLLPLPSGFIGSDTLAAMITLAAEDLNGTCLMVDVGTNGELVLARDGVLTATSCATGPVFEGAQIRCGMRAVAGAIEKVWVDPENGIIRYQLIRSGNDDECKPAGLCGSGVISAVSALVSAGIIEKSGAFNVACGRSGLRIDPQTGMYEMIIVPAAVSATGNDIVLTQTDIRSVQLGKAALRAGIEILMKDSHAVRLDRILLAGTFGSYLDPMELLTIGMLPSIDIEKIRSVGNAAGDGARLALFSLDKRREAKVLSERIRVVELATRGDFQDVFVDAMAFESGLE